YAVSAPPAFSPRTSEGDRARGRGRYPKSKGANTMPVSRARTNGFLAPAPENPGCAGASCASGQLRHGDFREALADVANESVVLILTDPPYGRDYLPLWEPLGAFAARVLKSDGLLIAYSGQLYLRSVLEDLDRHLTYLWIIAQLHGGQKSYLRIPNMVQEWKPILMFKKSRFRRGDGRGDVLQGTGQEKNWHPWQQAEDEAAELVKRFSKPGDLVIDPFVGSGTTGAAALPLGRRFL